MGVTRMLNPSDYFNVSHLQMDSVEHFESYSSGEKWTTVVSDVGTVSVGDEQGGVLSIIASDGTVADNDESYVRTTNEIFKFDASKPFMAEAIVQFSESNVDDANVAFGFANAVAANTILDNGGGLKVNDSSAVIYKVDGSNLWRCESSNGADSTTQTISESETAAGGSAYQRLRIEVRPGKGNSDVDITFFVDNMHLRTSGIAAPSERLITHINLPTASATEMSLFIGVKNGSANNETVKVKMVRHSQLY